MRYSHTFWRRLLAVVVVATGVAVVWGVAELWVASMVESALSPSPINENIQIAADGTPVVCAQARTSNNYAELSRRTLDGKPWPSDYESWLYGGWLYPPPLRPGLVELPIPWGRNSDRVIGVTDFKHPPTDWYALHDGQPDGHMYFVGYDTYSRMAVGFIGTQGFQEGAPDLSRQFSLLFNPGRPVATYFAATGMAEEGRIITYHGTYISEGRLVPWLVFVLEGDKLWQIDLRARTADVVLRVEGALALNELSTLQSIVFGGASGQANPAASSAPEQAATSTADPSQGETAAERLLRPRILTILSGDRIVLFDPPTRRQWEFQLPSEAAHDRVEACWIHPDELLLSIHDGYWAQGPVVKLLWIQRDGTIARRERVELHGGLPPSPQTIAREFAAAVPVPFVWFVGLLAGGPAELIQENMAPDYASALRQTWAIAWLPFVAVLLFALPAVWCVRHWQTVYRRRNTMAWCVVAFLLGPLGAVAYWLEYRRAKLETCGECGHLVPRDRDACADCHAVFPVPLLVGTEIFA